MCIEITLSQFEKQSLKKIEESINNIIFWNPGLRERIRKRLMENKILDADTRYGWGNTYYEALFSAILTEKTPSVVKVEIIIKSISIRDRSIFFFFVKNVLAEKNPICIVDDATKQLILALIKKNNN